MENKTILLTILGSTLLSALIAGIISLINTQRNKAIEFKYDYKRFILEKRKDAYNYLEKTITSLLKVFPILKKEEISIERLKVRIDESKKCRTELYKAADYSVWLSIDVLENVTNLNDTLERYEIDLEKIVKQEYSSENFNLLQKEINLREWAIEVLIAHKLLGAYLRDIVALNDIKKFIKERKRSMKIEGPK